MENWVISILPFMTMQLKLSGNELLMYAMIHAYTDEDGNSWHGSLDTAAKRLGCSKSAIQRAIHSLLGKELIFKKNKNGLPEYRTVTDNFHLKNETEKKPVSSPVQKKERTDKYYQIKTEYLNQVKRLHGEGKLPTEFASTNSVVINSRLKEYIGKGISQEDIQGVITEAAYDDFCVNQLNYALAPILSENVFYKLLGVYKSRQNKRLYLAQDNIIHAPKKNICPKCGKDTLTAWGDCYICEPDTVINKATAEFLK